MRTRAESGDRGQPPVGQAVRAGLRRGLLRAATPVPVDGSLHRVGDRQVQQLQEGPQGHRRGEDGDADGAARHRLARNASARRTRGTNEMPFFGMVNGAAVMGLADGPTEVHKTTVARRVLRDYQPTDDTWPTEWIPRKRQAARAKFASTSTLKWETCDHAGLVPGRSPVRIAHVLTNRQASVTPVSSPAKSPPGSSARSNIRSRPQSWGLPSGSAVRRPGQARMVHPSSLPLSDLASTTCRFSGSVRYFPHATGNARL